MTGNVIPLLRATVPRTRGIRLYIDVFDSPTARAPALGKIGTRQDHCFGTVEEARAFAAEQSARHGWAISDEIDDGGRAA